MTGKKYVSITSGLLQILVHLQRTVHRHEAFFVVHCRAICTCTVISNISYRRKISSALEPGLRLCPHLRMAVEHHKILAGLGTPNHCLPHNKNMPSDSFYRSRKAFIAFALGFRLYSCGHVALWAEGLVGFVDAHGLLAFSLIRQVCVLWCLMSERAS